MGEVTMVFYGFGFELAPGCCVYIVPQLKKTFVGPSREAVERAANEFIGGLCKRMTGRPADKQICVTVDLSQQS